MTSAQEQRLLLTHVQKRPVRHNTYGQMETPEKFQDMSRMCFPSNKFGHLPIASRFGFCSHLTPDHRTLPIQLYVHRSGITTHVILYFDSSERVLHQPHNPVNLPSHRGLVTARVSSAPICFRTYSTYRVWSERCNAFSVLHRVWEPILSLEILEKYMRNMLNYVNILLPEVLRSHSK